MLNLLMLCRSQNGHLLCSAVYDPRWLAKEAKKKEAGMAIADTSNSNAESANVVQESEWAFVV